MSSVPAPREYFLDSIRAWLMLLGIPFHISLIYSTHSWHVNSAAPSWWLTLFNDFIHAFRMQVFFVISGYFSYMLFLRYPLKRWWKVRVERVGIPMLTAIPLLTLPQFIMLQFVKGKTESWHMLSTYEKYNTLAWELISHLWFLLVLVILTTVSIAVFTGFQKRQEISKPRPATISLAKLSLIFFLLGVGYAAIRRTIFIMHPAILSDGMFNFVVMQTLFYVPFFILGALAFIHPELKARFTTPSRGCTLGAAVTFIAYLLNQRYGSGDAWMYETESVITMVMGLWMVNVVFSLGHRLLNFQSARVTYFVNASLFIYLVHHPLTLFFGAYITPHISSNLIGFLCGLIFVIGIALILYEIHLRIPLLKFLFSGKPPVKQESRAAIG
ncbi:glucans biosynthesis protein MdoC [Salmonella enterica]|uniref:Glucans biosynthesis protein C n=1 Tax=Salmonella enterica subsp. VII serovar 40:z4,z24:[z39] TaxID=1967625 RepID=A0A731TDQ1_SALEE|nr:glucans biosynthesis protein MdoC [Salmonella enterica]EDO5297090.1 glucans biosynthesis protein MdoC [Salmonella enterica subsp. houtenae serovar 40:z4,z24:-]EDS6441187.1 glucans biosynthesis protein MdoC [Salmonella enterica subsp. VII str. CFSAN000550]EDT6887314.1 glucans biosynthesis protein MdoC [Salmonella enterica subsp. enterica]EDU7901808.1 glucans biosynthesis protein MdoC [Salmonella enterica subsp. houtenae]QJY66123.1 glucans biosynthesis protein MdoC [Salmonella enterica subsp.